MSIKASICWRLRRLYLATCGSTLALETPPCPPAPAAPVAPAPTPEPPPGTELLNTFRELAFSQEGEDIMLDRFLNGQQHGFYIDVGCLHPLRFSNTQRFYMRGWRGINIDPNREAMQLFDEMRADDINIWAAIGDKEGQADYYMMSDAAFNTFDLDRVRFLEENGFSERIETISTPVRTLASVLEQHAADVETIDFISVDAEGWDINVLRSNDWQRFRPRLLLVEDHSGARDAQFESEMRTYLATEGYTLRCVLFNSMLYQDSSA